MSRQCHRTRCAQDSQNESYKTAGTTSPLQDAVPVFTAITNIHT